MHGGSAGDSGEGVIDEFRELIEPANIEVIQQDAPTSFRARYGSYIICLDKHRVSLSQDYAARKLTSFLPKLLHGAVVT